MRTFRFRFCLLVFTLSWLLRLGAALQTDRFHEFSRMDMERMALSLVNTGVLGNTFLTPTGPSAIVPPGYPLFLAAIFHLFGTGLLAETIKILACTAAASLRCALTPWLVDHLKMRKSVMVASGILSIFWIGAFDTELQGGWDAPYTTVLLILLIRLHFSSPLLSSPPKRVAAMGLYWGLTALLNPAVLSILGAILILEFWRAGRAGLATMVRHAFCVGACILLVLTPWAVRNRLALGSWIWLRDGMGLELELSYHDGSKWANAYNTRPWLEHPEDPNPNRELSHHPNLNLKESRRVAQVGELVYFEEKRNQALRWIREHPSQSLVLIAQHTFYFWFPPGAGFYAFRGGKLMAVYAFARWAVTVLAFAGLGILWRVRRDIAMYFGVILLIFPLVYYLVNWSSRYRSPIEWLLVLLASIPIAWTWERFARSTAPAYASVGTRERSAQK